MFASLVDAELERLGLVFPESVRIRLALFAKELERWNRSMNLTGLRAQSLVCRLIAEPVWVGHQLQMSGSLLDIGSGNGSPAFPLWLTRPFERMDLVEARTKRAAFLRHLSGVFKTSAISVHRRRLEDLDVAGPFDWVSMQAVKPTRTVLRALHPIALSTTTIVWITSHGQAPVRGASRISVPGSSTEVWSFQLDQF